MGDGPVVTEVMYQNIYLNELPTTSFIYDSRELVWFVINIHQVVEKCNDPGIRKIALGRLISCLGKWADLLVETFMSSDELLKEVKATIHAKFKKL